MKRFAIFDLNPLYTAQRERARQGEIVFLCGNPQREFLGWVDARNAADAVQVARERWPLVPLSQLHAEAGHIIREC